MENSCKWIQFARVKVKPDYQPEKTSFPPLPSVPQCKHIPSERKNHTWAVRCTILLLKKGGLREGSDGVNKLMRDGNGHPDEFSHIQFALFNYQSLSCMWRNANLSSRSARTQRQNTKTLGFGGMKIKVAIPRKNSQTSTLQQSEGWNGKEPCNDKTWKWWRI